MGRLQIKNQVTADEILAKTNNGCDIFQRELSNFKLGRNISSPFHTDSTPSFRIKPSSKTGIYIGIDYKTGKIYNGITLVKEIYGLTFKQALIKIAEDFNIIKRRTHSFTKKEPESKIISQIQTPIKYEFTAIPFNKDHHLYWNRGHLSEDFLKNNNIFAASHLAVNSNVIKIPEDQLCFVYVAEDRPYGELKILRIGDSLTKNEKWRTNIPNNYLWEGYKYKNNEIPLDNLWIIKSRKDEMIAKLLGINTVSVQSENETVLLDNLPFLQTLSTNLTLNYGSDPDGMQKSNLIKTACPDIQIYHTPLSFLPEVNDLFSFSVKFGLETLEKNIITKWNILNPGSVCTPF